MQQKKPRKEKRGTKKTDKGPKLARAKPKKEKSKVDEKRTSEASEAETSEVEAPPAEAEETPSFRTRLTQEDVLAMAEAIVEMVNDGAENPVAFFISGDEALGRELIQLQGNETEGMDGLVPVVLDAPQVRRFAMLTIADEMIWRRCREDT